MGFFDSVQSTFNRGVAAAGRTSDQVRLKGQMSDANRRRQNLAAQLGASLYELTRNDPRFRAGREALFDGIAAIDAERMQIQAELDRIEREAHAAQIASTHFACPFCGSQVGASDVFCSGCGRPMTEIQAALSASQGGAPANWNGPVCPSCGSPMNVGDLFCMSCGNKLDAPAVAPTPEPAYEPAPAPEPGPAPAPEPESAPAAEPMPEAEPASEPAPAVEFVPVPEPEPVPEPAPAPDPAPVPEPDPAAETAPVTEPAPEDPTPAPEPVEPLSAPEPAPAEGAVCPRCGTPAAPGDKFCMNCGFQL